MSLTCLTLVSALMFAQAGEKKDQPPAPTPVPAAMAKVVFVNASPDAVDVYVNGEKKVPALAGGKASTIMEFAAGNAKIEFKAGDKALLTKEAKLAADKHYAVVAFGKATELKAEVMEAKHAAGKAHVMVFHASPDAGKVDVNVDGKNATKGLEMGKSFDNAYDAAKHKFDLLAGSEQPVLTKELELKADTCTCLIANGMAKGTPKLDFVVVTHTFTVKPKP